jgi:uncharacterized protein YpmS
MRPRAGHLLKTLTWFARLISLVALSILFFVAIRAFYSSPDPTKVKKKKKKKLVTRPLLF